MTGEGERQQNDSLANGCLDLPGGLIGLVAPEEGSDFLRQGARDVRPLALGVLDPRKLSGMATCPMVSDLTLGTEE